MRQGLRPVPGLWDLKVPYVKDILGLAGLLKTVKRGQAARVLFVKTEINPGSLGARYPGCMYPSAGPVSQAGSSCTPGTPRSTPAVSTGTVDTGWPRSVNGLPPRGLSVSLFYQEAFRVTADPADGHRTSVLGDTPWLTWFGIQRINQGVDLVQSM